MDDATTHDRDDQDEARTRDKDGARDKNADERGTDDVPAPFAPDPDDKTPLGDTDEHSDA